VIVIHGTPDAAVHVQVAAEAVTMTWPVLPSAGTARLVGAIVKAHVGGASAPACVTGIDLPATVRVVLRGEVLSFAAIAMATWPAPVPLEGFGTTQGAALAAVHVQDVALVTTFSTALAAAAPTETDAGDTS
jgi:hypothetical protein